MSVQYGGDKITFADGSSTSSGYTFRNRIINGAMTINQRGFSGSNSNNTYTLDRWIMKTGLDNKFTLSQSSTAPAGFINSLVVTSSSAYSVPSNEFYSVGQRIEGLNLYDIGFGTANCKATNLSFWVRSSLTGTFGGALTNAAGDASYAFTYSISNADTWTQISIAVPAITTGTWVTDNSNCLQLWFGLGVGSSYSGTANSWVNGNNFSAVGATSVVGTSGATWYITGVQLEVGSSATTFEFRDYGREFIMCQRYYQTVDRCMGIGNYYGGGAQIQTVIPLPVTMRVAPTPSATGALNFTDSGANYTESSLSILSTYMTPQGGIVYFGNFSGITSYRPYWYQISNSSSRPITMDAEL